MLVAVWGLRLAWHVRGRAVGEHQGKEDPRYAEMLGGPPSEVGMGTVVRRVFLVQGVVQWFIAVPVMVGAVLGADWWPAVVAGVVVWAVGLFFETVGDRQLAAYKADPEGVPPPGDGPGPLALHPAPELLRRRHASGGASGWSAASARAGSPGSPPSCARPR